MTESNTSGSTRNVIDAFVSAQENKQVAQDGAAQSGVVQNGVVQNGAVSQETAPQVELKQNVATPNGTTQPAIVDKKTVQKRKNIWKVLIPVIAVAVVGVVIAAINLLPAGDDGAGGDRIDYSGFYVSRIVDSIFDKFQNDESYSREDVVSDFEELLSKDISNEDKANVGIFYAGFIYDYYDDAVWAMEVLERTRQYADGELVSLYDGMIEGYRGVIKNDE